MENRTELLLQTLCCSGSVRAAWAACGGRTPRRPRWTPAAGAEAEAEEEADEEEAVVDEWRRAGRYGIAVFLDCTLGAVAVFFSSESF